MMTNAPVDSMLNMAKNSVVNYCNDKGIRHNGTFLTSEDVYVVWFCKTLQNWKAMVSTVMPDHMYYEVTFNGDHKELYLDAYTKAENVVVPVIG